MPPKHRMITSEALLAQINAAPKAVAGNESAGSAGSAEGTTNPAPWQTALAHAIRDPRILAQKLRLNVEDLRLGIDTEPDFQCLVPESYLARIRPGDPKDPLLLQVLPQTIERLPQSGFLADPVGDQAARAAPGLLHKYAGRALLITTGSCAIHCRYCFRREFPYGEFNTLRNLEPALEYVHADPSIHEVILSGGDPLTLSDRRLGELLDRLEAIPHVQRLRIHTRLPVVLPERVDASLLQWLTAGRLQKIIILHANHAQEFAEPAHSALMKLKSTGIPLLNQAVLLAGINDDVTTLVELQEAGIALGVLPYYLHLLDRVHGAAHFEVSEAKALALYRELQARLPGYLVPRLVREIPGHYSKTLVIP
jgi:EF-P beta-lysylation protein EpmB